MVVEMDVEKFMEEAVERYLNRSTAQHGDPELAEDEIASVLQIWNDLSNGMTPAEQWGLVRDVVARYLP